MDNNSSSTTDTKPTHDPDSAVMQLITCALAVGNDDALDAMQSLVEALTTFSLALRIPFVQVAKLFENIAQQTPTPEDVRDARAIIDSCRVFAHRVKANAAKLRELTQKLESSSAQNEEQKQ